MKIALLLEQAKIFTFIRIPIWVKKVCISCTQKIDSSISVSPSPKGCSFFLMREGPSVWLSWFFVHLVDCHCSWFDWIFTNTKSQTQANVPDKYMWVHDHPLFSPRKIRGHKPSSIFVNGNELLCPSNTVRHYQLYSTAEIKTRTPQELMANRMEVIKCICAVHFQPTAWSSMQNL